MGCPHVLFANAGVAVMVLSATDFFLMHREHEVDLAVIDTTEPAMAVAELAQPMYWFKSGRSVFTRSLPELHLPD